MEKCGKVGRRALATAAQHAARGAGGEGAMRACSACAGDYEDPDRTAWTPDGAEDEGGDDEPHATREEFPADD